MCVHARVNSCKLNNPYLTSLKGVVCGSRAHLEDESIAQRTIIRTILMWVLKLKFYPISSWEMKKYNFPRKVVQFYTFCSIGLVSMPASGFLLWRRWKTPSAVSRYLNFSLLHRPFLPFWDLNIIKMCPFFFSCWREKLQRFFSTLFTLRDGLLTSRCWRQVSWMHVQIVHTYFTIFHNLNNWTLLSTIWQPFEFYVFKVAEMLQIPLGEVSVRWQEIDGSKLSPLLAAIEMFRL